MRLARHPLPHAVLCIELDTRYRITGVCAPFFFLLRLLAREAPFFFFL